MATETKVAKVARLVKERDKILESLAKIRGVKAWTKITIEGEDGAEHEGYFNFGGVSDNNDQNNKLAKTVHGIVLKNFELRLKENERELEKLITK